jgi:HlyD family secretion protein
LKNRVIIIVFVLLLIGVGSFVYYGQHKVRTATLYYSGTIETTQSELSFQASGRVEKIFIDEGQAVNEGQNLAELDQTSYRARYEEAKAQLTKAEKELKRVETFLEVYEKTLPADVMRAEAGVVSSKALAEEAVRNKERYDVLYQKQVVSRNEWETFRLKYETAAAQLSEAEAILKQARGNLKKIDATRREIEVAKAQYDAARATVDYAAVQLKYTLLTAPFNGIITSRNMEIGEVVTTGREVLSLADLSKVELKIYVGETEIGNIKQGQKADVTIDTFPDKVFQGTVSFVSSEAEFTPKIIQTHKERVKLVYLVKITVPNPELELKPGMPADAWLR